MIHLTKRFVEKASLAGAAGLLATLAGAAQAAPTAPPPPPTYADIADLADSAQVVIHAQVRKIVAVEPERSPGLRPGWTRYYVEAKTRSLLRGNTVLGPSLRYLVDLPPDARGRTPELKKKDVLLFGTSVQGPAGDLKLAAPDAQLLWHPDTEAWLRTILTALIAPDAAPRVTGVREAIHVPGNLAGEGETQFFLDTADRSAASITAQHRPGTRMTWGVSFSEVAARVGEPPQRDTLAWYRLACFLPNALPRGVNLSDTASSRAQTEADYRVILGELGACPRTRRR